MRKSGISMKAMVQQKPRMPRGRQSNSGGPPTDLDFEKALMFFHAYMYGPLQGKLRLYRARDVRSAGKALSSDWEVFASILVKDVGTKLTKGVDLSKYEVKSAENGGSYEYQYHRNTGKQKLEDDIRVGHLFFDTEPTAPLAAARALSYPLRNLTVRVEIVCRPLLAIAVPIRS